MKLKHWLRLLLVVAGACSPSFAWAWGPQGHVIVAKIAALRLNSNTRRAIAELIDDRSIADSQIANWADLIKHSSQYGQKYPKNALWHFADIPFDAANFDPARDCQGDNCVINRIEVFKQVAGNSRASHTDRKEALFFLVHLIGDLHQPLHCAQRNEDRGGNLVHVRYRGIADHHLNLHSVWDSHLVEDVMGHLNADDTAHRLNADISAADVNAWRIDGPQEWAWESHKLAVQRAYVAADGSELPTDGVVDLDDDYVEKAVPVVRQQLQRGGVRLAKMLNDAFAGND